MLLMIQNGMLKNKKRIYYNNIRNYKDNMEKNYV